MDALFSTLTLVTFFPVLGVAALAFIPATRTDLIRGVALITTFITFGLSLVMWAQFNAADPNFQLQVNVPWVQLGGVTALNYHLALDGISLWLVLLTTFLMPIAVASTWHAVEERLREFMMLFLLLEVGMVGVFLAADLFLFYIFWEFTLIPMYFLIGLWGGARRVYAAVKFFLFTLAGSLLMLVAMLWLGFTQGTFSIPNLLAQGVPAEAQPWLFGAFALAFAIKVPVFPLHTWLPDAHVEAPTAGSVILAGVLLKMGTYGLLRFNIGLFPEAALTFAPLMAGLGVIGIVYGAAASFAQTDAKKLVAYSSVSHLGFVVLGLFSLNPLGVQGALLQMVNHGLSTGALFLLVGMVYERRHTRELAEFGGLWKVMPVGGALMLFTALASAGLPGLNGFVGEFTILLGAWQFNPLMAVFAALGVILAAIYMLWLFFRMFLGPLTNPHNQTLTDLDGREIALLTPLMALMLLVGLAPTPFFEAMRPAVERLLAGL